MSWHVIFYKCQSFIWSYFVFNNLSFDAYVFWLTFSNELLYVDLLKIDMHVSSTLIFCKIRRISYLWCCTSFLEGKKIVGYNRNNNELFQSLYYNLASKSYKVTEYLKKHKLILTMNKISRKMKLTLHFFSWSFVHLSRYRYVAYRSGNAKILNPPLTSHKSQATPPTFIYQYYTSNVSQHEKKKERCFFFRGK